jgi:dTDP-4-amino-4,6-dideoxygalactose transaminase
MYDAPAVTPAACLGHRLRPQDGVLAMIPFNRPYHLTRSLELVEDAAKRGHLSGDGYYTERASAALRELTGSARVLLTTSCTAALEMAALLGEVGEGDEVLLPSFTFVSTANAFATRGAKPVFVDIREDTLNLDERLLDDLVTPRTKALTVVHYAGVACEMEAIEAFARRHGLLLVEDNAHGLGGSYRDRPLGSFGDLATLSFHETKNIQCGEGGALAINAPELVTRAEIIREKGTNRARFFRGEVDKYTWVDIGSSYLPSDILAAYLLGQLEHFDEIQRRRHAIWTRYREALTPWAAAVGARLPKIPEDRRHPAHLFHVVLPSPEARSRLLAWLRDEGIHAVFHYVPLHTSPMGRRLAPTAHCPVTVHVADRLVRLPLFPELTDGEQDRIIDAVLRFPC